MSDLLLWALYFNQRQQTKELQKLNEANGPPVEEIKISRAENKALTKGFGIALLVTVALLFLLPWVLVKIILLLIGVFCVYAFFSSLWGWITSD